MVHTGLLRSTACWLAMVTIHLGCASIRQHTQAPYSPVPGDLLFQDLDAGPLCVAIEKVTDGVNGADFSHVGMVSSVNGRNVLVIEAVGAGVVETPLEGFLSRSKDALGRPKVIAARIDSQFRRLTPKALESARAFLGLPYDRIYEIRNDAFYCSELIYEAYRLANDGNPLFTLEPMTFVDPDTGLTFPDWTEYYRGLGIPIPEGKPGLNPGGMSREPFLEIVHIYGIPSGFNADQLKSR